MVEDSYRWKSVLKSSLTIIGILSRTWSNNAAPSMFVLMINRFYIDLIDIWNTLYPADC